MKRALFLMLLLASVAWAFKPGDSLWVRDEGTPVFKEARESSKKVATLKAGQVVKWLGPSEKDKAFHLINVNGAPGYVRFTALTPFAPQSESQAHAGGSAAFSPKEEGCTWGTKSAVTPSTDAGVQAVKDLAAVEELNRKVAEKK